MQATHAIQLEQLIASDKLKIRIGLNQVNTVKWVGDTWWSSHLNFIWSLMIMFDATHSILKVTIYEGATYTQRTCANSAYNSITSFEFMFILHLMQRDIRDYKWSFPSFTMQVSRYTKYCHLIVTIKALIQYIRENRWIAKCEIIL